MYERTEWECGKTIEVLKYHPSKGHKGKRNKKSVPTSPKVLKQNGQRSADHFRRLVNHNFKRSDYHVVLTYKSDRRPTPRYGC